jgi:hypothetical protein
MSLWGATVITNLISAIPWIGQDIVEFIWGGFSVNNATLNRFFALHYLLPFILAALVLIHLIALHDTAGSSNPVGISGNADRISFAPYYLFKDLITIFMLIFALGLFIIYGPNVLGDSENFIMANPMQTPPAIVPEWYLLPFYAILRSIPDKFLGVIAMFSAILAILLLPLVDLSKVKGLQYRPLSKIAFWLFVFDFLILMKLGACHVESPYIEFGQICTGLYFSYFLVIVIILSISENTLSPSFKYNSSFIQKDSSNNSSIGKMQIRKFSMKVENKKENGNNRTILQRIWTGIKVGWKTPMIPPKVASFHDHVFTRIFRVLGGISVITFLTKKYLLFMSPFNYLILVLALLHLVYITIISIIKLIYGIKVLRSNKLEIRNSLIDHLAGAAGKLLFCWKYGCQVGSAGLGLVGTSFLIDSMLEAGNQEKVFTPLIGKGVNMFVKGKPADELLTQIKKATQDLESSKKTYKSIVSALKNAENALGENNELFTKDDIHELRSAIKKINKEEAVKMADMAKELAEKIQKFSESNK